MREISVSFRVTFHPGDGQGGEEKDRGDTGANERGGGMGLELAETDADFGDGHDQRKCGGGKESKTKRFAAM